VPFQIVALPIEAFVPLFEMDEHALQSRGARRVWADEKPGYPCRVSLRDAEVGEQLVLLNYVHHDPPGPYRSSGPVYVRIGAVRAEPAPGEVPAMLRQRLLSLRAYGAEGELLGASVVEGADVETGIESHFQDPAVAEVHIHNAGPGCYNCRAVRV
jgi:hypothetical protein